jgi:hypothetical protein
MLPALGESAAEEPVAEGLAWGRKAGNELQNDGVRACARLVPKGLTGCCLYPGRFFATDLTHQNFPSPILPSSSSLFCSGLAFLVRILRSVALIAS